LCLVRAQGRKILFTTNLPNVHDIDPALMRPGRCFATLRTRPLTPTEGSRLIARICGGDPRLEQSRLPEPSRRVLKPVPWRRSTVPVAKQVHDYTGLSYRTQSVTLVIDNHSHS
jgi:hypothetical protein